MKNIIENIGIIEIELFSFCNRRCGWCPNGCVIDRHSACNYLDTALLERLLQELSDYEYSGVFSFSRYNEPFYDFEHFQKCLNLIKEYFPYNKLVTNSNGDYIDKEIIDNTLINELTIMDYDCKGREWCLEKFQEWKLNNIQEYERYVIGERENLKVLYYWDWPAVAGITDRGGALPQFQKQKRENPCFEPFHFIGINYDGTVSPCCNIRNDIDKQKPFILGDLNNQSLKEILLSPGTKEFKRKVANAEYTTDMPCYYCDNKGGRYSKSNGGIHYD